MIEPIIIGDATLYRGDCLEVMRTMPDNSVDSIVTDPPYGIRFMGKAWDGADIEKKTAARRNLESHAPGAGPNGGHKSIAAEAGKYDLTPKAMRAFQEFSRAWAAEAMRILKPGGYLLSFSSARTYHRMVCGIEDAGFEIRDQIMWVFASGFPKSLDVSKALDKAAGAEREVVGKREHPTLRDKSKVDRQNRLPNHGANEFADEWDITAPATDAAKQWEGWGTALKPAHEPICVARKPFDSTVAENVLQHGTGAINIDGCRIGYEDTKDPATNPLYRKVAGYKNKQAPDIGSSSYSIKKEGTELLERNIHSQGRWPANLILSYPADEYRLRDDVTPDQLEELAGWLRENA